MACRSSDGLHAVLIATVDSKDDRSVKEVGGLRVTEASSNLDM